MKFLFGILMILLAQFLFGQNQFSDTINIPLVPIEYKIEIPNNALTIDSTIANDPSNQSLADIISKLSPIFIKTYGIGSLATVSMRGSGASHTNIMWNGIQINSSMNGLVDLSLFPSFFLDETSIEYGTSSLEGASGGIGGSINLNSNARVEKNNVVLNQQFGSFGFQNSQLSLNLKHKKWVSKTKIFNKYSTNNFKYLDIGQEGFPEKELQNSRLKQQGFKQDLYWNKSEKSRYGIQFWYHFSDRKLPSIYTVNNVVENQVDESFRVLVNAKYYFKESSLEMVSSILSELIDYNNEVAGINSISKTLDSKSYFLYRLNLKHKMSFKAKTNLDFSQAKQNAFDGILRQNRVSTFVDISKQFSKRIAMNISGRNEIILKEASYILPAVQISYVLEKKGLSFLAKYGQNIKYPTLNDLFWIPGGNPSLKAEESSTAEIAIKFSKNIKPLKVESSSGINFYQSKIENYILWRPSSFGYWQALNLKNVSSKGIEFNTQLKSNKGKIEKLISFNYTYVQSINTNSEHEFDNSKNKQLIYVPKHQYNVYLKMAFKTYFMSYNNQFVGARYTTSDNKELLSYYSLHDVGMGKSWKHKIHEFELSISVINVLNEEYQAIQWRPMPGRNYLINLKYRINEK